MSRRAIVFDLDGTLVDSAGAIAAAAATALGHVGLPAPSPAAVHALVGLPLAKMLARLAPADLDAAALSAVVDRYRADYLGHAASRERVFPGVPALLERLTAGGAALAVATGKAQHGADHATARHGLRGWFRSIRGIGDGMPGKPHPAVLRAALDDLGAAPEHAVMVGDTTYDLQMARAAGVRAIGVTWGTHDRARLADADPDALVDTLDHLEMLLTP